MKIIGFKLRDIVIFGLLSLVLMGSMLMYSNMSQFGTARLKTEGNLSLSTEYEANVAPGITDWIQVYFSLIRDANYNLINRRGTQTFLQQVDTALVVPGTSQWYAYRRDSNYTGGLYLNNGDIPVGTFSSGNAYHEATHIVISHEVVYVTFAINANPVDPYSVYTETFEWNGGSNWTPVSWYPFNQGQTRDLVVESFSGGGCSGSDTGEGQRIYETGALKHCLVYNNLSFDTPIATVGILSDGRKVMPYLGKDYLNGLWLGKCNVGDGSTINPSTDCGETQHIDSSSNTWVPLTFSMSGNIVSLVMEGLDGNLQMIRKWVVWNVLTDEILKNENTTIRGFYGRY